VPERAQLESRTVDLLRRLIAINTVNPPGNEEAAQVELRDLLEGARRAILAGETDVEHHGPYVALTMAQNLCATRLIRRGAHADVT
jgi:acetylornithine deacetylase/succinyl-diaminopimelate desuccinylase-like protein